MFMNKDKSNKQKTLESSLGITKLHVITKQWQIQYIWVKTI